MPKWLLLGIGASARVVAFFGLWMLLVDEPDEANIVTGGVCAVAAAVLATTVQSLRTVHARPQLSMLRYVYRPFLLLVTDTVRVARALLERTVLRRPVRGRFRAVRYRAAGDQEDDVARRLLTEWAASVAANRYAIGIDTQRKLLLVHELVEGPGPLDPLELG